MDAHPPSDEVPEEGHESFAFDEHPRKEQADRAPPVTHSTQRLKCPDIGRYGASVTRSRGTPSFATYLRPTRPIDEHGIGIAKEAWPDQRTQQPAVALGVFGDRGPDHESHALVALLVHRGQRRAQSELARDDRIRPETTKLRERVVWKVHVPVVGEPSRVSPTLSQRDGALHGDVQSAAIRRPRPVGLDRRRGEHPKMSNPFAQRFEQRYAYGATKFVSRATLSTLMLRVAPRRTAAERTMSMRTPRTHEHRTRRRSTDLPAHPRTCT